MAKGNPKGMGPDEPLDTLADHGIGLAHSRHTCFQSAFREWAHKTSPADWDDWKIHVDRNVLFHLNLTVWGCGRGSCVRLHRQKPLGYRTRTESGMGWLMVHTLARTKCTG